MLCCVWLVFVGLLDPNSFSCGQSLCKMTRAFPLGCHPYFFILYGVSPIVVVGCHICFLWADACNFLGLSPVLLVGGLYAIGPPVIIATSQEDPHKPLMKIPTSHKRTTSYRTKKPTTEGGCKSARQETPGTIPNHASRTHPTCAYVTYISSCWEEDSTGVALKQGQRKEAVLMVNHLVASLLRTNHCIPGWTVGGQ